MGYLEAKDIQEAKKMDLLTYLRNYEPGKLVRVSGETYCTKEHDSLKISNGKWHWFSRGFGGYTALDYLVKVENYSFVDAVETILGRVAAKPPVVSQSIEKPRRLLLPEKAETDDRVIQYLEDRGIHPAIIYHCIKKGLLYESRDFHSAVFIGMDKEQIPRYAAIRSSVNQYKSDASGSDKHYSFSVNENSHPTELHVFESAVDLLSFATMKLRRGENWKNYAMLSLAGVYVTKRENVVPVALRRYLSDYPEIDTVHLHLDNDEVGRKATIGIINGLKDNYTVLDEPPVTGKDENDRLIYEIKNNI